MGETACGQEPVLAVIRMDGENFAGAETGFPGPGYKFPQHIAGRRRGHSAGNNQHAGRIFILVPQKFFRRGAFADPQIKRRKHARNLAPSFGIFAEHSHAGQGRPCLLLVLKRRKVQ